MDETAMHICKDHAINPEEMTNRMKMQISDNVHESQDSIEDLLREQGLMGSKIPIALCFCT
jgi:hypothetical protein